MNRNRQTKLIAIIALTIAICGTTLGFAAFSATLTISSSAEVTPNKEEFKIVTSASKTDPNVTEIVPVVKEGATATTATITNGNKISDIQVTFKKPGQSVIYNIFSHNTGKYVVYLNSLKFLPIEGEEVKKKCIAVPGTSQELVDLACEGISIKVGLIHSRYGIDTLLEDDIILPGNHDIQIGEIVEGEIIIEYAGGSELADGPFLIQFGDIEFNFSTQE